MQIFYDNPKLGYLMIGTIATAVMAFLRCMRFDRRDFVMVITESVMCAMIAASILMGVRSMWHIATAWAVPIGVTVEFIGTSFIHAIIKRLIEFIDDVLYRLTNTFWDVWHTTAQLIYMAQKIDNNYLYSIGKRLILSKVQIA